MAPRQWEEDNYEATFKEGQNHLLRFEQGRNNS